MDQNLLKRPRELNSKNPETIPRELKIQFERIRATLLPRELKRKINPLELKNQFLDGNWKCQKKTKFFKWSRPKKLNSVRLLTRKYSDQFHFRWLEYSVIRLEKTALIPFNRLKRKPSLSFYPFYVPTHGPIGPGQGLEKFEKSGIGPGPN